MALSSEKDALTQAFDAFAAANQQYHAASAAHMHEPNAVEALDTLQAAITIVAAGKGGWQDELRKLKLTEIQEEVVYGFVATRNAEKQFRAAAEEAYGTQQAGGFMQQGALESIVRQVEDISRRGTTAGMEEIFVPSSTPLQKLTLKDDIAHRYPAGDSENLLTSTPLNEAFAAFAAANKQYHHASGEHLKEKHAHDEYQKLEEAIKIIAEGKEGHEAALSKQNLTAKQENLVRSYLDNAAAEEAFRTAAQQASQDKAVVRSVVAQMDEVSITKTGVATPEDITLPSGEPLSIDGGQAKTDASSARVSMLEQVRRAGHVGGKNNPYVAAVSEDVTAGHDKANAAQRVIKETKKILGGLQKVASEQQVNAGYTPQEAHSLKALFESNGQQQAPLNPEKLTKQGIREFQKAFGLQADGVIGEETARTLEKINLRLEAQAVIDPSEIKAVTLAHVQHKTSPQKG